MAVHPVFEGMPPIEGAQVNRVRRALSVGVSIEDERRVIHLAGELDLASRDVVHGACVADESCDVAIDLDQLTFLDCSGYSGLVAARLELQSRGGSLSWIRPTGQPSRFLALLAGLEQSLGRRAAR